MTKRKNDGARDHRRVLVSRLLARGHTEREIHSMLAKHVDLGGLRNPSTRKPWSLGTIHKDSAWCRKQWLAEVIKATDDHRSRQWGIIQEAMREAWLQKDIPTVLRANKQEMDLLGTKAPEVQEHTGEVTMIYKGNIDPQKDL